MTSWRLQSPGWLLLLLLLPLLEWLVRRRQKEANVLYSSTTLVDGVSQGWTVKVKQTLPVVRGLAMALMIVGLARPQKGLEQFQLLTEGLAIQMCLDRSGSMLGEDFDLNGESVNRLTAVKHVFEKFVLGDGELPGRPNDQIGLISFGGYAEGRVPLTLDHQLLVDILQTIEVTQPILDRDGRVVNEEILREERATAIGDAVALAVDRLRSSQAKSKIIILLSDGENTAGIIDPEEAAETAKTFGIKIYSIGVGRTGYAPFPAIDNFGRQVMRRQLVRLDEETLRMMADKTGGQYFNAANTTALESVYQQIDKLEKSKTDGVVYTDFSEWFPWFVIPGGVLLLLHLVLTSFWFQSLP